DGVDAIPTGSERGDAAAELHGDAEPVPAQRPQARREAARVAARVAEIADRSGDLRLDRFEDRVELRHLARVEDLLLLAVLGEEGHLLHPRLELGVIAIEVQSAFRDGLILEPFSPHQLVQHALAVLAQAELAGRGATRPCPRAPAAEWES